MSEITLYEHNRITYESVVTTLVETGKAAVIHPTGTGKSFIGFKLCEDNPNSVICWLSPSEYIFKTQIENLKNVSNGYEPENIQFLTYAKLMLMSKDEIAEIKPDYIILDEFHRCGADQWGKGVQTLLDMYPNAPVLGLSATNIRYLDNQRDMADELFDGNVASEMTLGEAIVRGILNAPKYVLSVYSYQKNLDKYKSRVKRVKSKAVRDKAEKYLEALRRTLEKADGLDEIFDKHMTDRTGKYIIFCSNAEHMRSMIAESSRWFGKIDSKPHIYSVYSYDPSASKSFQDFKADNDNTHLRLLYCIDALNEGIHVDDVSGVILLRPTVSPIIYKQQIGRALSASKKKEVVIFDIVLNIENLYSIDTIEQEMQAAITYYHYLDSNVEIVNENFKVIDELRDCRKIFDELNDTLTASWDMMYEHAKKYYTEFGNLIVPKRYKTAEGYSLGNWIMTQRKVKAGVQYGNLSEKRICRLNDIGMIWENRNDLSWEHNFSAAKEYYEQNGNLNVVRDYVTATGLNLGKWISNLRTYKKNNIQKRYLSDERIAALEGIGMIWDVPNYLFEQNFYAAMHYYREYDNLDVPCQYIGVNGIKLDAWLRNLRAIRNGNSKGAKLTNEQIERLNSIGMIWDNKFARKWEYGYSQAVEYHAKHGNLEVPTTYVTNSGFPLGIWLKRHTDINSATGKTSIKVTPERREKLSALGMVWVTPEDSWEKRYSFAEQYYKEHGDLNVPPNYTVDGVWLNKWLNEQKLIYQGKRSGKSLTSEQIQRLKKISFDGLSSAERVWESHYANAQKVFETTGSVDTPEGVIDNSNTYKRWLLSQRQAYRKGKLTSERIEKLNRLNIKWEPRDNWDEIYSTLYEYYLEHGNVKISGDFETPNGIKLYSWLANQKAKLSGKNNYGFLSQEQMKKLKVLGIGI